MTLAVEDAPTLSTLAARSFTETFGDLYAPDNFASFIAHSYAAQRFYAHHQLKKAGDYDSSSAVSATTSLFCDDSLRIDFSQGAFVARR